MRDTLIMFGSKSCGSKEHFISTGKIEIPLYLSKILTEWSKAAIRTQPSDLLLWSYIYFHMKTNGKQPPVKDYLDPPDLKLGPGGLTTNTLKALANTLTDEYETYEKTEQMWNILSLEKKIFMKIIEIGNFKNNIKSNEFLGITASFLNNNLKDTMIMLCNTLSTDYSNGILLDTFVDIYQYLARLDCVDIELSSNEHSLVELEIQNDEENTVHNDSQCFNSSYSQSCSMDTELSCQNEFEEPATNLLDIKSADGIMVWYDVNMDYGPESLTDILNTANINPPMITTICDQQDYELEIQKLKDEKYNQDILSLLSDKSVICNDYQSEILYDSLTDIEQIKNEHSNFEELGYEEMIDNPSYLVLAESNNEKNDFQIQNEEIDNEYTDISNDEIDKMSSIKYEDYINDIDTKMNEENENINSLKNIEVNKDYIVMMALVSDVNSPLPNVETENESVGDNDSLKSELSKTNLNPNTDDSENNISIQIAEQIFDEKIHMVFDKESSDSVISSDSEGFRHSQIDQELDRSMVLEKSSIHSESSAGYLISSKDDLASVTENVKFDEEQLSLHESSEFAQFEFIDTPEEALNQNKETVEECEAYLNSSEKSIDTPLVGKNDDTNIHRPEKRTHVVLGIGPTISEKQIKYVIEWVTKCASNQNNYVQEHNLIHFQCPPLDYKPLISNKKLNDNACF